MSDYIPADMVLVNYGLSPEAWETIQKAYREHLEANPTCEICKRRPSVRITPLGKIVAACAECLARQKQEMIEAYHEQDDY